MRVSSTAVSTTARVRRATNSAIPLRFNGSSSTAAAAYESIASPAASAASTAPRCAGVRVDRILGGRQPTATGMAVGVNNSAVINWTKSLSLQYAADGILVTTIAPGKIDTPRQVRNRVREAEIRGMTLKVLQEEGVYAIFR